MGTFSETHRCFLLFCLIAHQLIAILCAIYFCYKEQVVEVIFYILILSGISCSLVIFTLFKLYKFAKNVFLTSLAAGTLFLLISSTDQISSLWCLFTLPAFAILVGHYPSLIIISGLYFAAFIILINKLSNSVSISHDGTLVLRFLFSYGLLTTCSMTFENFRLNYLRQDKSKNKNTATQDALTELPNRLFLEEKLNFWHQKYVYDSHNFSIILADLDNCKSINDRYGRKAGDLALKKVSQLLTKELRRADIAGRWSANQLIMLLPNVSQETATLIAERLRQKASQIIIKSEGRDIQLTLSLGVGSMARSVNLEDLLSSAENCVYQAKKMGKNLVIST